MFKSGYRFRSEIAAVVLAGGLQLLSSTFLPAQTQPLATADPFVTYRNALSRAADNLLAATTQRFAGGWASDPVGTTELTDADTEFEAVNATLGRATRLERAVKRVQHLRPTLEPILREEGVPLQMAAVVLVESGGQPDALSSKGARGLWQIMPDTARRYGLIVSDRVDERLDLDKSTHAAARYLRDLLRQFGDWPLALAAYNAGEEAVQRAILRTSSRDFSVIARAGMLPLETRNYIPAVLGAMNVISGNPILNRTATSAIAAVVYAVDRSEELEADELEVYD
jgi:hypothetical protein